MSHATVSFVFLVGLTGCVTQPTPYQVQAPVTAAAKPSPKPGPTTARDLGPALGTPHTTRSLDTLLAVSNLVDLGTKPPNYERVQLKPKRLATTNSYPAFCKDEDGHASFNVYSDKKEGLRKMSEIAPRFGSHTNEYYERRPCTRTSISKEQGEVTEYIITESKYDAAGWWRSTPKKRVRVKTPKRGIGADSQLMILGNNRYIAYWTTKNVVQAIGILDTQKETLVEIDIGAFGRTEPTIWLHGFYLVSELINNECLGVYVFEQDGFLCAPLERRNALFMRYRRKVWQARKPLNQRVAKAIEWTSELRQGWKLRQVLPRQEPMYSELVAPSGKRYLPFGESSAVCYEADAGADARYPGSPTMPKRYLGLQCLVSRNRIEAVWWDTEEKVAVLPTEEDVHRQLSRSEVYGKRVSLFASGAYFRRWISASRDEEFRMWRFEDDRKFWPLPASFSQFQPTGWLGSPNQIMVPAMMPQRNVGPLEFALTLKGKNRELLKVDTSKSSYRVLRRFTKRDCPGQISWGHAGAISPRFILLHCSIGATADGRHRWSDVLDLQTNRYIRTPMYVRIIGENGFMFLTNTKTHKTMDNNHSAVFTAQMP